MNKIINNIILCIRFPFLYIRNWRSNTHYINRKVYSKIEDLYKNSISKNLTSNDEVKITITNKWKYFLYLLLLFYHNYILQIFHCIPTYTWLDDMESGWRKAFGIQMCKEIKQFLLKAGGRKLLNNYRIFQIKEKFGYLHWYDESHPEGFYNDIIAKYEDISYKTCGRCGKPATKISTGWIYPYCDDCIGNRNYKPIKNMI